MIGRGQIGYRREGRVRDRTGPVRGEVGMSLTAACPRRMPWHLLERARILRAHRKARAASPRCLSYVASGQPTFVTRVDAACLDRVARSREFAHDVCDDER